MRGGRSGGNVEAAADSRPEPSQGRRWRPGGPLGPPTSQAGPVTQRVSGPACRIFGHNRAVRLFRRSRIRYDMFDLARSVEDAKRAVKLQSLYHRGQELAWDGRQVLRDLIKKHGGVRVSPEKKQAIGRIFDVILW